MEGSVAIIGGGGAGLVSAQALLERGIEPVVFEARDGIGGNWRYDPEPGRSSCYASLVTNTSRWRTSLDSYRLGRFGPAYLRHDEMLAYLERYAEHFGLGPHIRLGVEIVSAGPAGSGWELKSATGERSSHRAVIVATGYNSCPRLPAWEGSLDGPVVHTHDYRTPERFSDLDVIVVGMGCSATELACEVSEVAASVTLLVRSRRDVIPHTLGGLPGDLTDTAFASRVPWSLRRRGIRLAERLGVGDLTRYGLPERCARPGDQPVAVTSGLRRALRSGRVRGMTGSISRLAGDRVVLADGTELAAGAILAGTGYRTEFPFLPSSIRSPTIERPALYRGIAPSDVPGLFFVGMVAGHGALLPMFEAQARWVAAVLAGSLQVPDEQAMRASIAADEAARERDFDPRWGIFFDRQRYVRAVSREARTTGSRSGQEAATLA